MQNKHGAKNTLNETDPITLHQQARPRRRQVSVFLRGGGRGGRGGLIFHSMFGSALRTHPGSPAIDRGEIET